MLLELALADAYGIGFEFVDFEGDTRPNAANCYYQHPKYEKLLPGQYTDDTQRSIATANVVLFDDPFSIASYHSEYVVTFKDDPRDGYSRKYQSLIESVNTGEQLMDRVRTDAESNGALMGVLPTGFLPTPGKVRAAAAAQAIATHSYATIPYAQDLALRAHYWLYREAKYQEEYPTLGKFLMAESRWASGRAMSPSRYPGPVKMSAHDTWCAVLELSSGYTSLHSLLRAAVDKRGDTDSVAALSVGIASLMPDVQKDISIGLVLGFEPTDPDAATKLIGLETALRKKYMDN